MEAKTGVESLEEYYTADDRATRLFAFGTVLAVLVGALGLYGLAAFNISRRVRKIGIRKSLGASSGAVAKLLVILLRRLNKASLREVIGLWVPTDTTSIRTDVGVKSSIGTGQCSLAVYQ